MHTRNRLRSFLIVYEWFGARYRKKASRCKLYRTGKNPLLKENKGF
jgi:hypothetical protein